MYTLVGLCDNLVRLVGFMYESHYGASHDPALYNLQTAQLVVFTIDWCCHILPPGWIRQLQ